MPQKNEKVEVKLPNGETVVAIVPAGMDDTQVGTLMRQKHPEYFPKQTAAAQPSDDDRSQMAGAMARMPQAGTTPQPEQGPVRRFLTRALDIPEGVFDRPGEYLNPFSHAYWNPSSQVQADRGSMVPQTSQQAASSFGAIPGRQTIADLKARNYAGAAGDVLPDLFAAAQFAVPAAGEVMQMPGVAKVIPRAGRYVGAGVGYETGGPVGAAVGGIGGDLAGRGLVKLAPRMARSVGVAAPAEAAPLGETNPTANLANELMRLRNPRLFDEAAATPAARAKRVASIMQQAQTAGQRPSSVTTPTESAPAAAAKPTVNVDDLVSTGRNLGLSPADAKARAQEAVTQFPSDENAAIRYMAGGKGQAPAQTAPAAKAEQPAASPNEKPAFSLGSMKDYSVKGQSAAKAEQVKAVQQEKAGIVNNPEFVSQRQRSNLAKNQQEMADFKAQQKAEEIKAAQQKKSTSPEIGPGTAHVTDPGFATGKMMGAHADYLNGLSESGLTGADVENFHDYPNQKGGSPAYQQNRANISEMLTKYRTDPDFKNFADAARMYVHNYKEIGDIDKLSLGQTPVHGASRTVRNGEEFWDVDPNTTMFDGSKFGKDQITTTEGTQINEALYSAIRGAKERNVPLYRGMDAPPEIKSLKPGDSLDLPLSSFSDQQYTAPWFGDTILEIRGPSQHVNVKPFNWMSEGEHLTNGRFEVLGNRQEIMQHPSSVGGATTPFPIRRIIIRQKGAY